MKIYFAGPIESNCWRHKIVPGLRLRKPNIHPHVYTGPFFIGCDHSGAHGRSEHGVAAFSEHFCCGRGILQEEVRRRCIEQIESSDLIFTWIDRCDAYGTAWELGYATAKKKRIVVRWPRDFNISDMWLSLPDDSKPASDPLSAFVEVLKIDLPVDSPIEEMLRDELVPLVSGRYELKTRYPALSYKLDFALWRPSKTWRIAVECDGHAFHEATKEQAERDRRRERELIHEGWTVLRFTGREIYRDAAECARTVIKHCERLDLLS